MKTFYFWLIAAAAAITAVSCVKNEPESCADERHISTVVAPETALAQAEKILEELDVPTRTGEKRRIAEMRVLGGFGQTRASEDAEEEPLVYLFNFENDEGYALISGDARVAPVLAFAERGNIDPEKGVDNPGLIMFLSNADTYYRAKVGLPITDQDGNEVYYNPYDPQNPIPAGDYSGGMLELGQTVYLADEWRTWGWTGEVIPCQWNQTEPFNKYCFTTDGRQAYAGCVAIAVAQIMFHYQKNCTYNGVKYDWNIMKTVTNGGQDTTSAADMVAKLIFQLGRPQNLNMSYGVDESGANSDNVPRTFVNFGYSKGGTKRGYDRIALCDGPLYVRGNAKKKTIQHRFLGINTWDEVKAMHG